MTGPFTSAFQHFDLVSQDIINIYEDEYESEINSSVKE